MLQITFPSDIMSQLSVMAEAHILLCCIGIVNLTVF